MAAGLAATALGVTACGGFVQIDPGERHSAHGVLGSAPDASTDAAAEATPDPCKDVWCTRPANCVAGECVCFIGEAYCDDKCIDVTRDAMNCGACKHVCPCGEYCHDSECRPPQITSGDDAAAP